MANAFAKLENEKSISTLAKRLFVIEGPGKAEAQRQAERAILKANPRLADPQSFRPGAVVIVPAGLDLKPTDRVVAIKADTKGTLDQATVRLQVGDELMTERFAAAAETGGKTIDQLGDRTFAAELKKVLPEAKGLVAQATKATKARLDAAGETRNRFAKAFEDAQAQVEKLRKLGAGPG